MLLQYTTRNDFTAVQQTGKKHSNDHQRYANNVISHITKR